MFTWLAIKAKTAANDVAIAANGDATDVNDVATAAIDDVADADNAADAADNAAKAAPKLCLHCP